MEKKNRLIVIGNGFDIAHGLKTTYSDFIDWLLCDAYRRYTESKYFEDDGVNFGHEGPGVFYTIPQSQIICGSSVYEFIKGHSGSFRIKSKFLEYLISRQHEDKRWVDIESLYFERLLSIFKQYKFEHSTNEHINEKLLASIRQLNNELEYLAGKLGEYLKTVNAEISGQGFKYDPRATISKVLAPDSDVKIMYLNFNYTDTLLKKSYGYESEVNYIHGRLGHKDNPIIFGYGDESTLEIQQMEHLGVNEYIRKLKSFAYLKTPNYKQLLTFIDASPFEVHIIGHSCGITDRALLKEIFEHANCQSIRVFFYNRADGSDSFEETTLEISRHFTNKQMMRRKLVNQCSLDYIPQFKDADQN